jgi:thiol peroxidase
MARRITFDNEPLTLVGRSLPLGSRVPDCTLVSRSMEETRLSRIGKRIKLITFFPSLDTPVCDIQVREFNRLAGRIDGEVSVIGISMDLPFAQKRFCETFDLNNLSLYSDYRFGSFGICFGVLIAEHKLLARGAAVVDGAGTLRAMHVVRELRNHPDYEEIRREVEQIAREPAAAEKPPAPGIADHLLGEDAVSAALGSLPAWELEGSSIVRHQRFTDFAEAKRYLDILAIAAEAEKHHPAFTLDYNRLTLTLTTHSAGGLTDKDLVMAHVAEQILQGA